MEKPAAFILSIVTCFIGFIIGYIVYSPNQREEYRIDNYDKLEQTKDAYYDVIDAQHHLLDKLNTQYYWKQSIDITYLNNLYNKAEITDFSE